MTVVLRLIFALTALTLCGCSTASVNPIHLSVAPLAVHTNYFNQASPGLPAAIGPHQDIDPNCEAFTLWAYHCFADFQTEDIKVEDTEGACTVRLKIKAAQLRLSCPVNVWLDAKAPPLTKEHEDGHIYICRKVYELAPAIARAATQAVVGKAYNGMGRTVNDARRMAVSQAEADISAEFKSKVVDLADEISQAYDDFCSREIALDNGSQSPKDRRSQQSIADEACQQSIGKTLTIM